MPFIALEYLLIAHLMCLQQTGRFHPVQFLADAIVVITEFTLQVAQVILLGRIQKELQQ